MSFTAANHPYFVKPWLKPTSPTEAFVRSYGPRLRHLVVVLRDGETEGRAKIDYVVGALRGCGKECLLDVIGSKKEGLKQIFSDASQ